MPIKLRDFQLAGVEKIRENEKNSGHGSVLAYDMGLGKTLTMSSFLIQQRLSESPIYPDLIVVPLCVLTQWKKEILRVDEDMDIYIYHGPDRVATLKKMKVKPDFVITTYHSLVTGELESYKWNRVVLDEAHAIRNGVTSEYQDAPKRALGAFALASRSKFRHCITGTPYNNNNNDILSLMKFIGGDCETSIQEFIENFVIQKTKEDIIDPIHVETIMIPRPPKESIQDYVNYLCLYYKLMYLLRSRTNPVEVRNIYRKSVMIMTKLRLYCDIMMSEKTGNTSQNKVSKSNKLNKIIIDESDDEFDSEIEEDEKEEEEEEEEDSENEEDVEEKNNFNFAQIDKTTFYDSSVKIKAVYDKLEEMIYKVPYKRIIIFSSFVTTLDIMEAIIRDKSKESGNSILTYKYIGSKNRYERENIVHEFTKEDDSQPMVLLASLGAGSCGLNLTPCSTVFLMDISMNPFDQLQAVNRVHRITQTNQVNVYKFCMKDMMEETILMAHVRKISEAKSNGLLIL